MTIRRATAADIPQIDELLRQVLEVHHAGRPDLFKGGVKKYTDEELKAILANDQTPVFVAVAPSANDGTDAEHNADSPAAVVPELLRTLVFARPCGGDQFAAGTVSPSLDMSR